MQGEPIEFVNMGAGTHFSIWTGEGNKSYFSENNRAQRDDFPLDTPLRYVYGAPGVYRLVVWASSLDSNDPSNYSRNMKTMYVKVAEAPATGV